VSAPGAVAQAGPARPTLAVRYRSFVTRRVVWVACFALVLLATAVVNVMTGPAALSLGTVLAGIVDPAALDVGTRVIIWEVRLPFALMAVAVGACLGLAGVEMQTVLNNPLASPSTLGLMHASTVGASAAIVFHLAAPLALPETLVVPAFAFMGAAAAAGLILLLSRIFGATVETVILFGIAMVFALEALVSLMQFVADSDSLQQIVFWTMGSLARATWEKLAAVAIVFACCLPVSLRQVWALTALRGGEDYAKSYGLNVERLRLVVLLRASLLTAVAVSFTGVIGFVGLVAPHIARLAVGEDHRFLLPASALAGAVILSGASLVGKSMIPGILIPDGIVTALIGIPLFLFLLVTQRRRA